ncbi:MAG: aminotransferase class I/II-fold pyridoxal phosphate-dependent enzyme [Solirubrobacterales bacterium]
MSGNWTAWGRERLAALADERLRRTLRPFDARGPVGRLDAEDRDVVAFASNDYLGLSAHPAPIAAAHEALERWGTGAGASRLVTGSRPIHHELEAELADWKLTDRALVFPTGYQANMGALGVFAGAGTTIVSDELNHASVIDAARLARGDVRVYPHADVAAAERLLSAADRAVLVTDAVFSMDGDVAPLTELAAACTRHDALLVVDEAHAVFELPPLPGDCEVVRMGTLSKTLGSLGGYLAGPEPLIELLVSTARSFVYTTALPPAAAAAALAALRVCRSDEGEQLRARLRRHLDRLDPAAPTPIVPLVLGAEETALRASETLLAEGLLVPAIRPPTVPDGTSRLRITLSAAHTDNQVAHLAEALKHLPVQPPARR